MVPQRNAPILTPDRRLRVFISSTMKELADERAAVRRAIEAMQMHPVLFEVGARPHPPRDLYRAYLEQSDVFVGIYWESYGWVAPDMVVSGLEDEFLLSTGPPRLVYIKDPAPGRDPQLTRLLESVASSGVSYRRFSGTAELEELVRDDLALLLTERFQASDGRTVAGPSVHLPVTTDEFIGRGREVEELSDLLVRQRARLITLTGPGGVGKTRLAIEVGALVTDGFPEGVHLVELQDTPDAARVPEEVAVSLALPEFLGSGDPVALLQGALQDKRMLLILDNFEHVSQAAPFVSLLLQACPEIAILVTSRSLLRLHGEIDYLLKPLDLRGDRSDAVELFAMRARSPALLEDREQRAAVGDVCRKLEGLPLAIELAAARTRVLPPTRILERLEHSLDLLQYPSPDLPERQRTMRATIAWSVDLLRPEDEIFFRRLAVFAGGFSLETVSAIADPTGELDALERMQNLIEGSLVHGSESVFDPRFRLLEPIRAYAAEVLEASGEAQEIGKRHAEYFLELAESSREGLRSSKQRTTLDLLEAEEKNIYVAFEWLVRARRGEDVVRAGWSIWPFWWMRGRLTEGGTVMGSALTDPSLPPGSSARGKAVRGTMQLVRGNADEAVVLIREALDELDTTNDPVARGLCLTALGLVTSAFETPDHVLARLREGVELLRSTGEKWELLSALQAFCWMVVAFDETNEPIETFEHSLQLAEEFGGVADIGMTLANLGGRVVQDDRARAASLYRRALVSLLEANMRSSASHVVEQVAELAVAVGSYDEAIMLYGFAEKLRDEAGELLLPVFTARRNRHLEVSRENLSPNDFDRLVSQGKSLGFAEGMERALSLCDEISATERHTTT